MDTNQTVTLVPPVRLEGYGGELHECVNPAPRPRPGMFRRAAGDSVRIVRVLLTATDATAERRPNGQGLGSELERDLCGSARAPAGTLGVVTGGRTMVDIAAEVTAAGWSPARVS